MRKVSSPSGPGPDGEQRAARRSANRRWPPSNRGVWLFLVCLAAYFALFLCTPLPSLQSLTRLEVAEMRLLLPDQYMPGWFGRRGSFMLLDRLPVLGGAAAILAVAWLLGACLLRWARVDDGLQRLERIVFALGAGLNAISLYTLAVGLAGGLHQRWAFFVPAALLFPVAAWTFWRSTGMQPQPTELPNADLRRDRKNDWLNPHWMWLGAPFLLAILLGGMLPPVEFDVREYHLEAPKEFYQLGRIEFLPHNVYANMALGSEMFSLLAMTLFGDWWLGALVGKTVTAAFAAFTVLALLAAGRRFFTPTIGYVAALIYISTPWIVHVSTSGLVEGASALYWLLAVHAVLLWRQPHFLEPVYDAEGTAKPLDPRLRPGPLVLAGWMAGAAVACKYPALLFVVVPLFVWIAWGAGTRGWKAPIVFLLAVIAGCGLWFAKNWVLTGNPTYPLLYEWFGGATRTAAKNAQWTRAHYPQTYALPQLTADLAQIVWRSEWLSPIALPLAIVSLLAAKYRRTALALWGVLVYIVTAWWLMTHRIDRFWVPALPVVALLAGLGTAWSALPAWRRVVLGLLMLGMTFNLLLILAPHAGFYNAYFAALEELRQAGWRVGDPWHVYLNHHVPPGWRLLAVGDAEMFDVEPLVLYNTVFDDSILEEICKDRTPEQIHAELLKRRISHIYVHWGEIARYSQPGNYGFPASINPSLFNKLVKAGVLESPLRSRLFPQDHPGEVYPVRGVAEANLEMLEPSSASEPDSR